MSRHHEKSENNVFFVAKAFLSLLERGRGKIREEVASVNSLGSDIFPSYNTLSKRQHNIEG